MNTPLQEMQKEEEGRVCVGLRLKSLYFYFQHVGARDDDSNEVQLLPKWRRETNMRNGAGRHKETTNSWHCSGIFWIHKRDTQHLCAQQYPKKHTDLSPSALNPASQLEGGRVVVLGCRLKAGPADASR